MLLSQHTRRREVIALLGATAAWPLGGQAQQPAEKRLASAIWWPPRGMIGLRGLRTRSLVKSLRVLGYMEGQNIVIEQRFADRDLGPAAATRC